MSAKHDFYATDEGIRTYSCPRCGYISHELTNFKKHLLRKSQCKAIISDADLTVLRDAFCNTTKKKQSKQTIELKEYVALMADYMQILNLILHDKDITKIQQVCSNRTSAGAKYLMRSVIMKN